MKLEITLRERRILINQMDLMLVDLEKIVLQLSEDNCCWNESCREYKEYKINEITICENLRKKLGKL
jgi:hypothetical protein